MTAMVWAFSFCAIQKAVRLFPVPHGMMSRPLRASLNAADMPSPMNVFEFAARMWRGASAMAAMQEYELGGIISLSGQELADLIAFAHDAEEQAKLNESQIPEQFRERAAQ